MKRIVLQFFRRHPSLPAQVGSFLWTLLIAGWWWTGASAYRGEPTVPSASLPDTANHDQSGVKSGPVDSGVRAFAFSFLWLLGLAGVQGSSAITRSLRREQEIDVAELQDRERRYRNLIEGSPDAFWIVDEQGRILEVNDVYVRHSGYNRDEIIGRHVWDFEANETQTDTLGRMARMREQGGAIFDTAHRAKDGSIWPIEAKVTFSPDGGGRYAAFFRDLTRHKRDEVIAHIRAQLADRVPSDSLSRLLEAAIEQAQVWTGSSGGYFHFIDPEQGHLTQRTWTALRLANASAACPAPSPTSTSIGGVPAWAECVRTGEPVFVLNPLPTPPSENTVPSRAPTSRELVVPIRAGTPVVAIFGVVGKSKEYLQADADWLAEIGAIVLDLTQRKRAQEELSQFFNLVPDLICILTATGRMHRLNPEWERVLGIPLREIQSGHFLDRVHPEDRRRTLSRFVRVARGGSIQAFVNRCRAADGSYRWIEWNAASMPQEQLICAAASDVTDRLRSEHLNRLQRDLGMGLASAARDQDPNAILEFCLGAALDATDMECGSLYLRDPSTGAIEMVVHRGLSPSFVVQVRHCAADSPKARLVDQGAAVYSRYSDLISAEALVERDEGLLAIGVVPVVHDGKVVGCINVASRTTESVPPWARRNLEALLPQIGNVVARFLAEQALRQSEQRFRLLFDHAVDAIFWADANTGTLLNCNRAAETLLDRPRWEILGKPITFLHPPEQTEHYRDLFLDQAQREILDLPEGEVVRRDGTLRTVTIAPALIDVGGQRIVQASFHDITTRVHMQNDLIRHQALLEAIFDNAPIMICLLDRRGDMERMNRAMARFLGAEAESTPRVSYCLVLGCTHAVAHPECCETGPECRGCLLRIALEDTRRTGNGQQQVEFSLAASRNGRKQEVRLSASTSLVSFESSTKLLVCFEDITASRQLEIQFRQAQKMEAVGQLAGGVAHDFNNILGAMMMNLHLVRETSLLDPEVDEALRDLEKEAQRGAELTRRLLLLGRREIAQIRRVNLDEIVDGLLKMLRRQLGEHVDLEFVRGPEAPWVSADPSMLEQVVLNLCVNARDAMPKGGPLRIATSRVEITPDIARRTVDARVGSFVCLAVKDEGTGMEPEVLERVFEPFFTTKGPGSGTGLGLATVYGIVRQHQGWIDVESHPGLGTQFQVFLPAATASDRLPLPSVDPDLPRGTETLLLVEDDASLRRTATLVLRNCGYHVIEASHGAEALRVWENARHPIQLLFTDIVMPGGMSGIELAETLRASQPSLKVLLTTGYSAELVDSGGLTNPEFTLLPKPYTPAGLAQKLRQSLDRPPV